MLLVPHKINLPRLTKNLYVEFYFVHELIHYGAAYSIALPRKSSHFPKNSVLFVQRCSFFLLKVKIGENI
jgi:hypothetical protein